MRWPGRVAAGSVSAQVMISMDWREDARVTIPPLLLRADQVIE
jgi:hypothetical protein